MNTTYNLLSENHPRFHPFRLPVVVIPWYKTGKWPGKGDLDRKQEQAERMAMLFCMKICQTEATETALMAELPITIPSYSRSMVELRLQNINRYLLAWGRFELDRDSGKILFLLPFDEIFSAPSKTNMFYAIDLVINTFLEYISKWNHLDTPSSIARHSVALWMNLDASWPGPGSESVDPNSLHIHLLSC
ncbi:MAG: hypothetical protein G8345_04485 [Magnetococcales bacterium]|nr:hypothetical protein [Magnetococcales bacterium]NGZ26129.1 hypothetical protein [Magnetococcales bacterium]